VLYRFQGGSDGSFPGNEVALVFDRAGNIYGTTRGASIPDGNAGTVFELSPSSGGWTETVLHRFVGGEWPLAGVPFDAAGNLYGTIYEMSPSADGWVYQTIYTFHDTGDGGIPWGGLARDAAGNFYGATTIGNGGPSFSFSIPVAAGRSARFTKGSLRMLARWTPRLWTRPATSMAPS